jgi:3-oxoacyl-[acyl-carrier-protein] synthase III
LTGDVGVRAYATALGDLEISARDIAEQHGVTEAVVGKWLGASRIYATREEPFVLGIRAAKQALERAGIAAGELSIVLACGCSALRVQHELGATNAYALQSSDGCVELAPLLFQARALLQSTAQGGRALIVCADQRAPNELRAFGRMSEMVMRDIFSDGAGALLLESGHPRMKLLGTGAATDGQYWSYFDRFFDGDPVNDIAVMKDSIPLFRNALRRCLESTRLSIEAFDAVVFPLEGPRLPLSFARVLAIPPEKIFFVEGGPTHLGASDPIFALEQYLTSPRAVPGARILVATRTVGVMHFIAFEV